MPRCDPAKSATDHGPLQGDSPLSGAGWTIEHGDSLKLPLPRHRTHCLTQRPHVCQDSAQMKRRAHTQGRRFPRPQPRSTTMAWNGGTSPGFPPATRRHILQRDPTCRCPGCPHHPNQPCTHPSTEADHITRPADGGTHHPNNGRGLCHRCHTWRTAQQANTHRPTQQRPPEPHPGLT